MNNAENIGREHIARQLKTLFVFSNEIFLQAKKG